MDMGIFRGRIIGSDKWVAGNLIVIPEMEEDIRAVIIPVYASDEQVGKVSVITGNDICFNEWDEVDIKTLSRYSGKDDKFENPIYERDICKATGAGVVTIAHIIFDQTDGFEAETGSGIRYRMNEIHEIVIIGNSIDNPQFLQ